MDKKSIRNYIMWLGIPIVILVMLILIIPNSSKSTQKYSDITAYFDPNGEQIKSVKEFYLDLGNGNLEIKFRDNTETLKYAVPNLSVFLEEVKPLEKIEEYNNRAGAEEEIILDYKRPADTGWITSIIPTIVMIGFFALIWYFMMKRMGGESGKQMNFGKAKIKKLSDEKKKTTFDDVAGADEEKEDLAEIVEFLKDSKKYDTLGARVPKGILLIGPPGTGKTLLARAVAGEAGVPFFSISGSDFVEMFVGVGASRVRDLFEQAKKNHPCIIFIDEIDAVGRHRGAGLGGGHDEREQTLNQLLVEMDGFGANEGVIMIAATNRPDILDPALTRPGRFDRQVMVGYPDIKGREEILKVHARKKPLAPDVNLATIAKTTAGFTGADLENLLNESALLAARKDKKAITMEDIEEATIKVAVGAEKKSRVISEKEKKLVSYHEAGHAVATYYCETQDPVHQISIIPRGMAGGFTMSLPSEDKNYRVKKEMLEDIVVMLGGRVAEALVLADISTGASNDIERATKSARSMVMRYGMSDKIGPVMLGGRNDEVFLGKDMGHTKDYSEEIATEIDAEVREIITNAYKEAENILNEHMDKLHGVAKYLMKHEKMDAKEFKDYMDGTVDFSSDDDTEIANDFGVNLID